MRRFIGLITGLSKRLATASGFVTALIAIVVFVDIVSRSLFNHSVQGASELAILLLVVMIFIGFGGSEAKGENFSVTFFYDSLGPSARRTARIVSRLVSVAAVGMLAWFSWLKGIDSTVAGEQSYGVIAFPIWPSRLVIAFGLTVLALQLVAGLLTAVFGLEQERDD